MKKFRKKWGHFSTREIKIKHIRPFTTIPLSLYAQTTNPVIGLLVRLFTRKIPWYEQNPWYEPEIISKETNKELEFWLITLTFITDIHLSPDPWELVWYSQTLLAKDTKVLGYRGFTLIYLNKEVCSAKFKGCEEKFNT